MKGIDPARMSRAEILAELGQILAAGHRRIPSSMRPAGEMANAEKALDETAETEASCGSTATETNP